MSGPPSGALARRDRITPTNQSANPATPKPEEAKEVLENDANLSIRRYVRPLANQGGKDTIRDLKTTWAAFEASGREFWQQMDDLVDTLEGVILEEPADAD